MTRMTGPDCVVMCNLIKTYIHILLPRQLLILYVTIMVERSYTDVPRALRDEVILMSFKSPLVRFTRLCLLDWVEKPSTA